jgi:hypothetical protein
MTMSAFLRFAPHLGDEAALVIGAGRAQAGFAARVERDHSALARAAGQLGAVAGLGRLLPLGNLVKLVDLFQAGQDRMLRSVTSLWRQR